MRKLLMGFLVVLGAGCGGGGGGSSGQSGPATGTISGQAFTPAAVSAVTAGPATCSQPTTFTAKALAVRFASYAGASSTDVCTNLTSDPLCKLKASATTVTVAMADIEGTAGPTLGPGTFNVTANPASAANVTFQTSGPLAGTATIAFAASVATGTSCPASAQAAVAQGTLIIDAITSTDVTGSIDLTFGTYDAATDKFTPGQGTLSGAFDAPLCSEAIAFDLCSLAANAGTCGGTPSCD